MLTYKVSKNLQRQKPIMLSPMALALAACGGGTDTNSSSLEEQTESQPDSSTADNVTDVEVPAVEYLLQSDTIGIMSATGQQTFQWMPDGSERAVVRYYYPEDLDGDGNEELVLAGFETQRNTPEEYSNTDLQIFSISSDGVLTNKTTTLLPNEIASVEAVGDVVFGDFNGDGRQDYFTSAYADMDHIINAYAFTQVADGTFARKVIEAAEWQHGASVGDINADGFSDVIVTGYTQDLYVYVGSPDGLVEYTVLPALKDDGGILVIGGSGITFGDFLGNGETQIVVTDRADPEDSNTAIFSIALNDADETVVIEKINDLPSPILDQDAYEDYLEWDDAPRPGERSHDVRVDKVDFNQDGNLDVIVFSTGWPANGSWPDISTVQFLQNDGNGSFVDVTDTVLIDYEIDSNSSYATVFADFNNDGYVDLFVSDSDWNAPNNSTSFILSNGDGTYSEQGRDLIAELNQSGGGVGTVISDSEDNYYLVLGEQFIYSGANFTDPTTETLTVYPVDFL